MAITYLPTNFKDDILAQSNPSRKYAMTENQDGTVSFEDETVYTQSGSNFGAGEHNATNSKINEIAGLINNGTVIPIDTQMSSTSTNAVQNKVIKAYVDNAGGGEIAWKDYKPFLVRENNVTITSNFTIDLNLDLQAFSAYDSSKTYLCVLDGYISLSAGSMQGKLIVGQYDSDVRFGSTGGGVFRIVDNDLLPFIVTSPTTAETNVRNVFAVKEPKNIEWEVSAVTVYDNNGDRVNTFTASSVTAVGRVYIYQVG